MLEQGSSCRRHALPSCPPSLHYVYATFFQPTLLNNVEDADDEENDDVENAASVFCVRTEVNRASELDVDLDGRPLGHADLSLA